MISHVYKQTKFDSFRINVSGGASILTAGVKRGAMSMCPFDSSCKRHEGVIQPTKIGHERSLNCGRADSRCDNLIRVVDVQSPFPPPTVRVFVYNRSSANRNVYRSFLPNVNISSPESMIQREQIWNSVISRVDIIVGGRPSQTCGDYLSQISSKWRPE